MNMYDIVSLENSVYSEYDFDEVNKIELGKNRYYYVLKNRLPFLRVEVDLTLHSFFDTAVIFNKYLCIGAQDQVFFIDMNGLSYKKICVDLYFGYFYIHKDMLFVLSGEGVIAFDNKIHEIWRRSDLATDGVIADKIENDNILVLSCEMDPPGGWITQKINILNGNEVK